MNGYFITYGDSVFNDSSGVSLKIRNQIRLFNMNQLSCEEVILPISKSKMISVLYRLPWVNLYPIWKLKKENA